MKFIIIYFLLFTANFSNFELKSQCTLLTLSQIQQLYNQKHKEDMLLELGFDKTADTSEAFLYGKCKKILNRKGAVTCSNHYESITIFKSVHAMIYSTFDKNQYLKIKKFAKTTMKYLGNTGVYDEFLSGTIIYGFSIDIFKTDCGSLNRYTVMVKNK